MSLRSKATPAIKLDTLSSVNDLGKPWRYVDEAVDLGPGFMRRSVGRLTPQQTRGRLTAT